jgi:hypothetical protein
MAAGKPSALSDDDYAELNRLLRLYSREAKRAIEAKAYLASCVMQAAVIETQLALMVDSYLDEAVATGKYPIRKKVPKPIFDLTLAQLISIAKAAGWLPTALEHAKDEWSLRKAKIGDFAEVAREIRNLVHPGSYARYHTKKRVTKLMAESLAHISDGVNNWLLTRIDQGYP